MRGQESLELVLVERGASLHEVVDRRFGHEPETEADVSELEVEVDEAHPLSALRQGYGEIDRRQRLPGAALRPEDADERRLLDGRVRAVAVAPGHRLLEHETNLVGRLWKHD